MEHAPAGETASAASAAWLLGRFDEAVVKLRAVSANRHSKVRAAKNREAREAR